MIDWPQVQMRLKAAGYDPGPIDGDPGRGTYGALFAYAAGRKLDEAPARGFGIAAAVHIPAAGIDDDPLNLAAFFGQTCHESGGYRWLHERGGSAYFAKYDGRKDLGNTQPGDGARYHGRGILQITGRANYRDLGRLTGFDFEAEPDLVARPDMGVMLACRYWTTRNIGPLARAGNDLGVTRKVNGGTKGLDERIHLTNRMKGLLI